MQIKILAAPSAEILEKLVSEFLKDAIIDNLKFHYSISAVLKGNNTLTIFSVFISYNSL